MSDGKPPVPQDKSASATGGSEASLAGLIAQTPGAQTREQLIERINARRQKRSKEQANLASAEEELVSPEPLPFVNQSARFAARFRALLEEKTKTTPKRKQKAKPTKRSYLRLVVDNDKPKPSDKK
jgi:hypothetical protein